MILSRSFLLMARRAIKDVHSRTVRGPAARLTCRHQSGSFRRASYFTWWLQLLVNYLPSEALRNPGKTQNWGTRFWTQTPTMATSPASECDVRTSKYLKCTCGTQSKRQPHSTCPALREFASSSNPPHSDLDGEDSRSSRRPRQTGVSRVPACARRLYQTLQRLPRG